MIDVRTLVLKSIFRHDQCCLKNLRDVLRLKLKEVFQMSGLVCA